MATRGLSKQTVAWRGRAPVDLWSTGARVATVGHCGNAKRRMGDLVAREDTLPPTGEFKPPRRGNVRGGRPSHSTEPDWRAARAITTGAVHLTDHGRRFVVMTEATSGSGLGVHRVRMHRGRPRDGIARCGSGLIRTRQRRLIRSQGLGNAHGYLRTRPSFDHHVVATRNVAARISRPAKCCSFDSLRAHYDSRSTSLPRLGVGEPSRKTGQERRALRARRTRSCAALNSTHWRRNRSRVVFDSERSQRRCV